MPRENRSPFGDLSNTTTDIISVLWHFCCTSQHLFFFILLVSIAWEANHDENTGFPSRAILSFFLSFSQSYNCSRWTSRLPIATRGKWISHYKASRCALSFFRMCTVKRCRRINAAAIEVIYLWPFSDARAAHIAAGDRFLSSTTAHRRYVCWLIKLSSYKCGELV